MRILSFLIFINVVFAFLGGDYKEVIRLKQKEVEVVIYSKDGKIKSGGNEIRVEVKPPKEIKEFYFYMPPMPGMNEMRDVAKLEKKGEGVYEGFVNISMDGPWEIRIMFADGTKITRNVFIPLSKETAKETKPMEHSGHIMIPPEKLQLLGVITEPVKKRFLVRRFYTVGYVDYNREKVYDITVRADAWVEKTYGRFEGEYVKKGTPLMKVLSPDIEIAKREYKLAKKIGDEKLIKEALRKLRYLKAGSVVRSPVDGVILQKQVYEGGYLKEGQTAYRIADLSTAWIVAEVPLHFSSYIRKGLKAFVSPEGDSTQFQATVDYIFPEVNKLSRTLKVRLKLKNENLTFKPNALVNVSFEVPIGEVIAVPESAVVDTGRRRFVFVEMEKGMYMPVQVKLGRRGEGYYEVIHGLKEGQRVVVKGTFLLDAEAQIKGLYGKQMQMHHHH
ncbi:CzcB/NccB family metal efflux transporter periplasmic adaptor subunit [Aquifex aeolicus]|uniref:Cation efflux system (CzcB-like) n=1 Tax=Aquifex aeolicus (strain VF5) TaxID=224324 RepID=O67207_AQUAE|nr:CzcB/NccB family metal efflux transporter periplasmic adaptor subunit [Aquifex aeolicus]AAC07176.1 cation efflux system (czcB-like) [Aquifex aeolicus VF5]